MKDALMNELPLERTERQRVLDRRVQLLENVLVESRKITR
jgi:hypothetical protein